MIRPPLVVAASPLVTYPKVGLPNHGNDRRVWQVAGCDPSLPNPEYRV